MNASGIVMFAAMQILVEGRQDCSRSENMASLRYGVSMNICVCRLDCEAFSMLFMAFYVYFVRLYELFRTGLTTVFF